MTKIKKARVTKDQWLAKAMELFAAVGEDGLRIDILAKEVGVAKASFYCHFNGRDDLLNHLLNFWIHEHTGVITSNTLLLSMPPKQRLMAMMDMSYEQNLGEFDIHFLAWARKDQVIAKKVKQTLQVRYDFFKTALEELGFSDDELEMRARIFTVTEPTEHSIINPRKSKEQIKNYRNLRLKMLLQRP
jgi:AcrR family transcriptional regulator